MTSVTRNHSRSGIWTKNISRTKDIQASGYDFFVSSRRDLIGLFGYNELKVYTIYDIYYNFSVEGYTEAFR